MIDYKSLTNEELLAERHRLDSMDEPNDKALDEIDSIIFRRTGASDGDITNDYFFVCIELKKQAEEIRQLKAVLRQAYEDWYWHENGTCLWCFPGFRPTAHNHAPECFIARVEKVLEE